MKILSAFFFVVAIAACDRNNDRSTMPSNSGGYDQINRFWEATPPHIAVAAVDEIGNFMLHPDTAAQVQRNLQALADKYWASHKP